MDSFESLVAMLLRRHFMEVIRDDNVEILNAVPPGWEDAPDLNDDDDEDEA